MLLHKTYETDLEKQAIIPPMIAAGFSQVSTEGLFIGNHLLFDDGVPEPEPEPEPEPPVFTASPPGEALGKRLKNIEDFLGEVYPGEITSEPEAPELEEV